MNYTAVSTAAGYNEKGAFSDLTRPLSYLNYDIHEGKLFIAICAKNRCSVIVKINTEGFFGSLEENVIHSAEMTSGNHTLSFDEAVLTGFGTNYLHIFINESLYYTQRL